MNPLTAPVEALDGPFVTPKWGVQNANGTFKEGGGEESMKSKIAILSCLAVAAMMILPTVSAGSMTVWTYTDKTDYTRGETVEINVDWITTDPNDFDHDYCYVYIKVEHGASSYYEEYEAEYDVPEREVTGDFPIYCGNQNGFSDFQWDSTGQPLGGWTVYGEVTAWDYSQSPPDDEIFGDDDSTFTLN